FIAEFLVLMGGYQANIPITVIATLGLIAATVYSLWLLQRAFLGQNTASWQLPDLNGREGVVLAALVVVIVWLGVAPQPVLNAAAPALETVQAAAEALLAAGR